jgi:SAM-dependent methyltransferase
MLLQLFSNPDVLKAIADKNNNLLIKLFVLDKSTMLCFLCIQKFENNKCDIDNLKVILHEIYEDLTLTKPLPILLKHMDKSLRYMYQMYQYQGFFSELHPGTVHRININESFWSDNVEFTMTLVDSTNPNLIAKNDCKAIIIGKSHTNDFLYINKEGNYQLCEQVETSRLLLFRANPFNHDSTEVIKQKIEHYILLFKFKACANDNIPILMMSDPKKESFEVYSDERITIQDVEDENKNLYRQLIFNDNFNEIQSEIKVVPVFNERIKKEEGYIALPTTIKRFLDKKMKLCLDEKFIGSYYIKSVLSGLFFLKGLDIEKNPVEVLILGSGIGTINHFLNKLLKNKVKITSVEIDKKAVELGREYFGFKTDNSIIGDARQYIKEHSNEVNKYDLIIIDINNTDQNQGISPPPVFFEKDYLKTINVK